MNEALSHGYEAAADELFVKFEAISSVDLFSPVLHLLPATSSRVLDIGAGTGRDAAWFASMGHSVVAVEPVAAFRDLGYRKHKSWGVEWIDDSLPALERVIERNERFDLVVVVAVWHHLSDEERRAAFGALGRVVADSGTVIISVRAGIGVESRHAYPASLDDLQRWARHSGFAISKTISRPSIQHQNRNADVTWTWIVMHAVDGAGQNFPDRL